MTERTFETVTLQEVRRALWGSQVEETKEGFATVMEEFPEIYFIFPKQMPLDNEGRILERFGDGIEDTSRQLEAALNIDLDVRAKTAPYLLFGKLKQQGELQKFFVAVTADEVLAGSDVMVMTSHSEKWHQKNAKVKRMSKHYQESKPKMKGGVVDSLIVLDVAPELSKCREDAACVYAVEENSHEATLKDYLDNLEAVKAAMMQLAPRVMSLTTPESQWSLQLNRHSADLVVVYDDWKFYIEFPYNGIYVELLQKIVTEPWVRQGWKAHMRHMFGSFTSGWTAVDLEAPELKLRWFAEWIG